MSESLSVQHLAAKGHQALCGRAQTFTHSAMKALRSAPLSERSVAVWLQALRRVF